MGRFDISIDTNRVISSDTKHDESKKVRLGTGNGMTTTLSTVSKGALDVPITIPGAGASTVYSCETIVLFKNWGW